MPPLLECPAPKTNSESPSETPEKKPQKNGLDSGKKNCSTSLDRVPSSEVATPRKLAALKRLGVSREQLAVQPDISSILKQTRAGIALALKALRFSQDGTVEKFLKKYDSIPARDRKSLPIEAVAIAAKVDLRILLGEIMLAVREHSVSQVKIIAVASHPQVIKSRVQFAKLPGGFRDRDALDTMLGALPSPKGPTFIGKFFAGAVPESEQPEKPDVFDDEMDVVFPDVSKMQERIHPVRQKLLEGK